MTPHDLSGLPICRGEVVACPAIDPADKLCFGIVSEVCYNTGAVVVQTIMITRIPVIMKHRFLFPCNQVVLIPQSQFDKNTPEHKLIRHLIREHNS